MDFFPFLIFGLASWRVASMFVREKGPFNMFVWIREMVGIQHDENNYPYLFPDNVLADLLSCVWCTSMWAGLFWFLLYLITPLLAIKIATVFAFSTVAIIVDKWVGN